MRMCLKVIINGRNHGFEHGLLWDKDIAYLPTKLRIETHP